MGQKNPKGLFCSSHPAARLKVVTVRRVAAGVVLRYRRCPECGRTIPTEERIRPRSRPNKFCHSK